MHRIVNNVYNAGHNILELYVLVKFRFVMKKSKLDIYYDNLDYTSRVAKQLKT